MANIGDLVANLSINRRGFSAGLGGARRDLAGFSSFATSQVGNLHQSLMSLVGVGSLLAGVGFGLKLASDAETTQIAFEVMIGSATRARRLLMELKQVSDKSPLSQVGTQEAAKTLLQYDMQVQDVIPTIKRLGDLAGANEEKFQNLAYAFGQVTGYGYLQGQELRQLVNAGWNPLLEISRKTGESIDSLKTRMGEHKISTYEVAQALKAVTSEGGRFFNMTERQALTMSGRWSTMNDTLQTALREMGQALIDKFDLKTWVTNTSEVLKELPRAFRYLTPNIQITLIDWEIALEEWAGNAGGIMTNVGIVFSSAWDAMGKNFTTFTQTMKAGLTELQQFADAKNKGWMETWQQSDANNWIRTTLGLEANQQRVDPRTGKRVGAWEAGQQKANKALAGQKDAMPPGTDLVSQFTKNMAEQNKAARDALGGKTHLEHLKDRKEEFLKGIGESEAARQHFQNLQSGKDGELNASFLKNSPDSGKDKGISRAALKGSQDAAKIMLAGRGGKDDKLFKVQNDQLKVQQQIAKNTAAPKMGVKLAMADF